jgi:hypothetical protein
MQYSRQRKFIEKFRIEVLKIKTIWPKLNLEISKNGISLKPSMLPILEKISDFIYVYA